MLEADAIQKYHASEQLGLKLKLNSPAQLPLLCPVPQSHAFLKSSFSFRGIQAVLARLDQITAGQVRWLL